MAAPTGDTASDAAPAVNVLPSEAKTGVENFAPIAAKSKARTHLSVSPAPSPNEPAIVADAAVKIDTDGSESTDVPSDDGSDKDARSLHADGVASAPAATIQNPVQSVDTFAVVAPPPHVEEGPVIALSAPVGPRPIAEAPTAAPSEAPAIGNRAPIEASAASPHTSPTPITPAALAAASAAASAPAATPSEPQPATQPPAAEAVRAAVAPQVTRDPEVPAAAATPQPQTASATNPRSRRAAAPVTSTAALPAPAIPTTTATVTSAPLTRSTPAVTARPDAIATTPHPVTTTPIRAERLATEAPAQAGSPVPSASSPPAAKAGSPVPPTDTASLPLPDATALPGVDASPVATAAPAEPRRPSFIREVAGTPPQAVALAPQLAPAPLPAAGVTASAAEVFGAAIHAAQTRDDASTEPAAPGIAVAAPAVTAPIAATTDTGGQMLDLRQERWPHAMIDHIERLRDAADAGDTRIRLVPDALGAIDVAVRRDGDAVHVHFVAEQATTRTLLQDAQPRLAQAAEERGVKLGQTSVDHGGNGSTGSGTGTGSGSTNSNGSGTPAGQTGAGSQQPQPQARQTPTRPAPARPAPRDPSTDERDPADAGRLA
ncbi:flagellar hook-length control protein FliK [Sphingomonas sp. MA1305]|nr:flagellar hook-length control protein FliK [Sphingomonas sp. MA1305]